MASEYKVGECGHCGTAIVVDDPELDPVHVDLDADEPRETMGGQLYCDETCQGIGQGWLDAE